MAYTSEIDKLERRHRENPEGRTFAPLADAYRKAGDVARALEILKVGLQLHPDYLSASIVLGRCHLDLGDLVSAESAFRRVLELDKENVIAIKALADITERLNRLDESEHWLNYLLSIDGSNEEARGQLQRLSLAREQQQVSAESAGEEPIMAGADSPLEPSGEAREASPAESFFFAEIDTVEITPLPEYPAHALPERAEPVPAGKTEEVSAIYPPAPPPVPAESLMAQAEKDDDSLLLETEEEAAPYWQREDSESPPPSAEDHFEIGVVRAEEIVLRPSASTEYQVPSDADTLAVSRSSADFADSPEEHQPAPPPSAEEPSRSEAADESLASAGLWQSHPEDATAAESAAEPILDESLLAEQPADERTSSTGSDAAISPDAWEPPTPIPAPSSTEWTRSSASEEPVPSSINDRREEEKSEDSEEAGSEPEEVVTETMGDVYAAQGLHVEALFVYRQLLSRTPDDARLKDKIDNLERRRPSASKPAQPGYSAAQTGGQSVLSYFGDLLTARLTESGNGAAEESASGERGDSEPVATNYMEETFRTDVETPGSGEPTRPASGPLSLSAIFGEDSSPVPPVVAGPEDGESRKAGSAFDEFFGERSAPAGTIRTHSVRTDADQDDLEQFHKWLKGLKR